MRNRSSDACHPRLAIVTSGGMPSPSVPVLLSELVDALDDNASWTRFHYLDRETGAVETALTAEADGSDSFVDVRADPHRFVRIEPLPQWLRLEVRTRFVEQQVDDAVQRLDLLAALRSSKPLPSFDRLLRAEAAMLDAYRAFRERALAEAARDWCRQNKVRPGRAPSE